MAVNAANIHIGQGEIWVGGTPPAGGSDPNDPTLGTPSAVASFNTNYVAPSTGGVYVGFTNGAATLTYRPTFYMVETEQAMAEVVTIPTNEEATLAFTMLEANYTNIATAYGQGVTRVGAGFQAVYVGSKSTVTTRVILMLSRKRTGTGYYLVTLYAGYSHDGAAMNFERRAEARIQTTARCLADVSRPVGDQLYQLVAYDANP